MKKIFLFLLLVLIIIIVSFLFYTRSVLGELTVFTPYAKNLLGFDEGKKYLLIFQNNNELRPSGGFISAYGILNLNNGKFNLDFADSYSLTEIENLLPAPEPFNILLEDDSKFQGWYFRDANFAPDFRRAAQDIEKLFWQQAGLKKEQFDGIFAINFEFLENLVEIYDLNVGGIKINKANLFSVLEHEVKNIDTHDVEELKNRKNILGDLSKEIIYEATHSPLKYRDLFRQISAAFNQKQILLNFKNNDLQEIAEIKGWAGKLYPADYDNFIHSNITNIGGRKADRYVKKRHEYFLSFNNSGRGIVRYSLSMEHFGTYNLNSDIYNAYIRVFIPTEAEYLEEYLEIKPGESKEISFQYLLPEDIKKENFNLDLIKQSGTNDFWEVTIQLPTDYSLISEEFETRENLSFWSGALVADKHFDFEFLKDITPPLVVWQKLQEPNLIEINFSEALDEDIALDPGNYKIEDLNYINDQTDTIEVEKIYFKNSTIYLKTRGLSSANEERYKLTLTGLQDKAGNKTKPEELEITVVQRLLTKS